QIAPHEAGCARAGRDLAAMRASCAPYGPHDTSRVRKWSYSDHFAPLARACASRGAVRHLPAHPLVHPRATRPAAPRGRAAPGAELRPAGTLLALPAGTPPR